MKDLSAMSLEELWQLFPIVLREYNPEYKIWYSEMKTHLLEMLGDFPILRISHIGSTSVEGLAAKPIVDILLELEKGYDMDRMIARLQQDDWILMYRKDDPEMMQMVHGYTPGGFAERVFHLHIRPLSDWDELYFRDYLIHCKSAAAKYAALKQDLKERYTHNRDAYTEAKHDFVKYVTDEARMTFGARYK